VGRNENADGFYDYTEGFTPDHEIREELGNFGAFGDPNETLLAKALSLITGTSTTAKFSVNNSFPLNEIDHSKNHTLLKDRMYLDKDLSLEIE
jgi:hypothetical protein